MEQVNKFYEIEKLIGEGSYAQVLLARDRKTKKKYAVKNIKRKKANLINLIQEVQVFSMLKKYPHPDIVGCLELFEDSEEVFLVYEYLPNGDLLHWLARKKTITEAEARRIFWSVVSAVNHLHSLGIVHRDIKLENICVGKDGDIKLVDFNLCSTWSPERKLKTYCGSLCYCAPEICLAQPYVGPEVDVWSLGVLLYVLLFCRFPFDPSFEPPECQKDKDKERERERERARYEFDKDKNSSDDGTSSDLGFEGLNEEQKKKKKMAMRIVKAQYWFPNDKEVSASAKALVDSMLVVDTSRRSSLPAVMASRWLSDFNSHREKEEKRSKDKEEKRERRKTLDMSKNSYGVKFQTMKDRDVNKKEQEEPGTARKHLSAEGAEKDKTKEKDKDKGFLSISSRQLLDKLRKLHTTN